MVCQSYRACSLPGKLPCFDERHHLVSGNRWLKFISEPQHLNMSWTIVWSLFCTEKCEKCTVSSRWLKFDCSVAPINCHKCNIKTNGCVCTWKTRLAVIYAFHGVSLRRLSTKHFLLRLFVISPIHLNHFKPPSSHCTVHYLVSANLKAAAPTGSVEIYLKGNIKSALSEKGTFVLQYINHTSPIQHCLCLLLSFTLRTSPVVRCL